MLEARAIGRQATRSNQWLIRDVNLSVGSGDKLAIVGPSGSGKTVLLRALCLLDPLHAGNILWNGAAVRHQEVPAFRSYVMYLRQQPAMLEGTVEENLRQPFLLKVHSQREFDVERIAKLLKLLGRDKSFLQKQHSDLSGGEIQIVSLLRSVQLEPQILLLDEPTAALDSDSAEKVETIVAHWIDERPESRATVWVTHDLQQARRISNRIARVAKGALSHD